MEIYGNLTSQRLMKLYFFPEKYNDYFFPSDLHKNRTISSGNITMFVLKAPRGATSNQPIAQTWREKKRQDQ